MAEFKTIDEMFRGSVAEHGDLPAILRKEKRVYVPVTYRDLDRRVEAFGRGLRQLGIAKGDRVAILSENRMEWAVTDLALARIGAVSVGIFPTLPASQVEYILVDSAAKAIIVSDRKQRAKALEIRRKVADLAIIAMEDGAAATDGVTFFDEVIRRGEAVAGEPPDPEVRPGDWASLIYTSGTMGDPKGVILTHGNITSNVRAGRQVLPFAPGDVLLSFVPLNHVMGRMVDHYLPLSGGSTIAYVENLRRLRRNIQEVRPHYMVLVPRVLEMFREGLIAAAEKEKPLKKRLFFWALASGTRAVESVQNGGSVPAVTRLCWWLGDRLVFSLVRAKLGLDRLKVFFSGGAPLSPRVAEFFAAVRLPVMEGYGLSETSPLVAVNPPDRLKFGTVGRPVPGVEVRIAKDGEILVRGPNVMQGYYNRPEDTAEAIDPDGWFHTGDVGEMDADGHLRITDRKKALLVLANGKKVASQQVEARLIESSFIAQALVVGDHRSTVGALIVPEFGRLHEWAKDNGVGAAGADDQALVAEGAVQRLIQGEVQRVSEGLAEYEKVRRFVVLDHEFRIENGELTPTLKVRRKVVLEKYRDMIDSMYGAGG